MYVVMVDGAITMPWQAIARACIRISGFPSVLWDFYLDAILVLGALLFHNATLPLKIAISMRHCRAGVRAIFFKTIALCNINSFGENGRTSRKAPLQGLFQRLGMQIALLEIS